MHTFSQFDFGVMNKNVFALFYIFCPRAYRWMLGWWRGWINYNFELLVVQDESRQQEKNQIKVTQINMLVTQKEMRITLT